MRKVSVVVGSRANYSSIKSVMSALKANPSTQLQTIAMASALLSRYGSVIDLIKDDGFKIDEEVFIQLEGENLITNTKSTGIGIIELASSFKRLQPDVVVTVGDRFETMATTIAAAYMNIPLAHTMGGEVTGNIDESIRHAVTKFANLHFPSNKQARDRIIKLGEDPNTVFNTGCPRIDLVAEFLAVENFDLQKDIDKYGVGAKLDMNDNYLIVSQHPVTTEYEQGRSQIIKTLEAVKRSGKQALVLWPNADAGSESLSTGIRVFREQNPDCKFRYIKNLPVASYVHLMKRACCLVGNSSSGIREGAYIGTPVVNIGSRQQNRQRGSNVVDCEYDTEEILRCIEQQSTKFGTLQSEPIYGSGTSGVEIAKILASANLDHQKLITY